MVIFIRKLLPGQLVRITSLIDYTQVILPYNSISYTSIQVKIGYLL